MVLAIVTPWWPSCPLWFKSSATTIREMLLEVQRHVESRESRRGDRGRRQPCRAVGPLLVGLLIAGGDVRVEQVVQVDADVEPPAPEAKNLREAHVDQVDAVQRVEHARVQ